MKSNTCAIIILSALLPLACAQKPVVEEAFDPHWAEQVEGDHNHEVLFCYQDLLKTKPAAQGYFAISVDTDPNGAVKNQKVVESLDPKFDACVMNKVRGWHYPWFKKSMTGLKDDFHLSIVNGAPISEFGRPYVLGDDVKQTITNHMPEVRECYETAHRSVRHLAGKLTLQWYLDASGRASDLSILQPVNPKLDDCVEKAVASWKFPTLPGGDTQKVSYPFTFSYK